MLCDPGSSTSHLNSPQNHKMFSRAKKFGLARIDRITKVTQRDPIPPPAPSYWTDSTAPAPFLDCLYILDSESLRSIIDEHLRNVTKFIHYCPMCRHAMILLAEQVIVPAYYNVERANSFLLQNNRRGVHMRQYLQDHHSGLMKVERCLKILNVWSKMSDVNGPRDPASA